MKIIETVGQAGIAAAERLVATMKREFAAAIRPIYGATAHARPDHIGSCVLVEHAGTRYLITAAHVADWAEYTELYIAGMQCLKKIQRSFLATPKDARSGRPGDHYDIAITEVSSELDVALGNVRYITDAEVASAAAQTIGRQFLALGYPNSKNDGFNNQKKTVKPALQPYYATAHTPDEFKKVIEAPSGDHIYLPYDSKHSKNATGAKVNSIRPKGMSGGALFDIGGIAKPDNLSADANYRGRLAGILIENPPGSRLMIATKIWTVLDALPKK